MTLVLVHETTSGTGTTSWTPVITTVLPPAALEAEDDDE